MNNRKIIAIFFALCTLMSCAKHFDTLTTDPETISTATPGSFLNSTLLYTMGKATTNDHDMFMDIIQVTVATVEGIVSYHRYVIPASASNSVWRSYYLSLTDLSDMENISRAANDSNYLAIAKTLKVWLYQQLTDTYGDIPYFQSNKGYSDNNYQPKFDTQQDIYTDMLKQLDSANNLYINKALTFGKDILYGADADKSNILKWKKLTNSLRLRLLMRIEGKSDQAKQLLTDMLGANKSKYPLISSNKETAAMNYTNVTPLISPFYNYRAYDFNGAEVMSSFWADSLSKWNDPRLPIWFSPNKTGNYTGIPSGYPLSKADSLSSLSSGYLNAKLRTASNIGIILQYAEVEFLLAEAAQKGYLNESAQTHYENGIAASMQYWGATMPTGYLQKNGIAYDGSLKQIITQKYFALFFQDLQQWAEYRRTGYPTLTIGSGAENNGILPTRLVYPLTLQSLNATNYQAQVAKMGGDNMQVKLWWAK